MKKLKYLEEKAFTKIGRVIEVNGNNVTIKIERHIGKTNLFHNGNIYRNISMGGMVKVEKDFLFIIGRVTKDFIQEKIIKDKFFEERYITILIIGHIKNNKFIKGVSEIPHINNEAFILSNNVIESIYNTDESNAIYLGRTVFEEIELRVGVSNLFASHIGIFGNTGSGKSNTLAYLLNQINEQLKPVIAEKSKFIIIDFNGEYSNNTTISNNKFNVCLSTQSEKDKLVIKEEWLDEEFWSIFLQATDKTQKPFIKRTLNLMEYYLKDNNEETLKHIQNALMKELKELLEIKNKKDMDLLEYIKGAISSLYEIVDENVIKTYKFYNDSFFREATEEDKVKGYDIHKNGCIYFNKTVNVEKEIELYKDILDSKNIELNYLNLFEVAMRLRIIKDVKNNLGQLEHISPILVRFSKRKGEIKKLFTFGEDSFIEQNNEKLFYSISLKDVNLDMKKLIPLILVKKIYEEHKRDSSKSLETLHIIIDEAHNILSEESNRESEQWKDYRLEVFEEVIKEGRKFGVFLIIASQRPSDISSTIISQLHNLFIHRLVNELDLRAIAKSVSFIDKLSFDSLPILGSGNAVFTGTAIESPILLKIPLLEKKLQPQSATINLNKLWFNE